MSWTMKKNRERERNEAAAATTATTTIELIAGSDNCTKHRFQWSGTKPLDTRFHFFGERCGHHRQCSRVFAICIRTHILGYGKHYYCHQWLWLGNQKYPPSIGRDAFGAV